jgi:hypothetical protein
LWDVNSTDLVGKTIRTVFPPGTNEHLVESLNEVLLTCAPVKKTRKIPFKEKALWIESILVPILRDGEIDGVMGMSRDITERKAAEPNWSRRRRLTAPFLMRHSMQSSSPRRRAISWIAMMLRAGCFAPQRRISQA